MVDNLGLQIMATYERVFSVSTEALGRSKAEQKAPLLAVACEAASLKARILHQQISGKNSEDSRTELKRIAAQMLQLVKQCGSNHSPLKATAEIIGWAKLAGKELPSSALEV